MHEIESWTRELLRLPPDAAVRVRSTAKTTVIITPGGHEVRFDVPAKDLRWFHLAQAMLSLGPSCTEPHVTE